jgi:hypothetical protein
MIFNCKTFKDYMELYLTCDVLILADFFMLLVENDGS